MLNWKPGAAAAIAFLASGLGACGGGGNESGPPDEISVYPAAVSVSGGGSCAVGIGPTVHVYGGQPPYELSNSVPDGMVLDKSVLTHSGEGFTVSFINGVCMDSMPIVVEDDMGRLATVTVSNTP